MRFATLGGQDAPDWLLACLVDLSRLSPAQSAELVQAALHGLLGQPLADGQLTRLADETALGANRVKAGLAALHHLLNSAAKYQVDTKTLSCELQQLGLPEGRERAPEALLHKKLSLAVRKAVIDINPRFWGQCLHFA
eukprot:SM000168S02628  [mRNA]  locus=s168:236778:237866:+ [translate_table: standard]